MSENRHTAYDLAQMQSLPLDAKILMTKERIRQWYEHWDGQVYVSFSGGKDSTVLKHIVDSMYDDIPAVFINTGLEYPEIQTFVRQVKNGEYDDFNANVEIIRPEMRFDEVLKKHGYPVISKEVSKLVDEARRGVKHAIAAFDGETVDGKPSMYRERFVKYDYLIDAKFNTSDKCCDVMKKKPAKQYEKVSGRKPMTGSMAHESALRRRTWIRSGCNAFDAVRPVSNPMSFWTEQDVLHYLKKYNVPYCSVYGDIVVDGPADEIDGQMNAIDYLGDYDPADNLRTTGCSRTGCVFCAFGCHLQGYPNNFQRLKKTHPKQWEYCINGGEMVDGVWQPSKDGLGLGRVLDYIGVKYE